MYAPQRPDACRKASLAADAGRQLQAAAAAVARHRRVRARRPAAVGCGWLRLAAQSVGRPACTPPALPVATRTGQQGLGRHAFFHPGHQGSDGIKQGQAARQHRALVGGLGMGLCSGAPVPAVACVGGCLAARSPHTQSEHAVRTRSPHTQSAQIVKLPSCL